VYVDADQTRLAQALCNLLSNAVKNSEPRSPIRLTVERQGNEVALRVKDAGIGIPSQMLPRVFDPFWQVDRTQEKSEGGLGLGLTIVKRLVEMQGGSVEARSGGPGKGSEFLVRLPVVASVVQDQSTAGELSAQSGGQHRILLTDDNVDSDTSLGMMLSLMGQEVRTAHDGLEAEEAAAAFKPDVIFLDIGMPKLNGYDTCRRIREHPGGEKMIIVALTGWRQDEDKRRSQEAGFNSHLVKPVEPAALGKLLARLKP
jgi:CheY-like chemotaxis protein